MGILNKKQTIHCTKTMSGKLYDLRENIQNLLNTTKGIKTFGVSISQGHSEYGSTEQMVAVLYYTLEFTTPRFPKLNKYFKR